MSAGQRSDLMSKIRSKGTKPERLIMQGLRDKGLQFEEHTSNLPGKPDIVFREQRLAVFIDGDFWHGWRFPLWEGKLSQKWRDKIAATRVRDQRNFRRLRRMGWEVLRVWEHEVERDTVACANRIEGRLLEFVAKAERKDEHQCEASVDEF